MLNAAAETAFETAFEKVLEQKLEEKAEAAIEKVLEEKAEAAIEKVLEEKLEEKAEAAIENADSRVLRRKVGDGNQVAALPAASAGEGDLKVAKHEREVDTDFEILKVGKKTQYRFFCLYNKFALCRVFTSNRWKKDRKDDQLKLSEQYSEGCCHFCVAVAYDKSDKKGLQSCKKAPYSFIDPKYDCTHSGKFKQS